MSSPKTYKDLEKEWYDKLQKEDFKDIEDTSCPSRPLIEWHSFKITSQRFQILKESRSLYQTQIDTFLNHPDFNEICKNMVSHGNSKFDESEIKIIWEMHAQGLTFREIKNNMGRSTGRIYDVIKGLRAWMKLL